MAIPISIVITTYNRERFLGSAIASVLAQTHQAFELLVWDDGSTDQSVALAHSYAQQDSRVRVMAAEHQGHAAALKAAIAHTTGTYLGWVDDDDVLAPEALTKTLAVLDTHPKAGLVYTDYQVMNEAGQVVRYGSRCQIPYSPARLLDQFMTFHFRLIRRSVYEQVGGVDGSFESAEDYDLCLRLSEVTNIIHLKQPLYFYRVHPQCLSIQRQQEQTQSCYRAIAHAIDRRQAKQSLTANSFHPASLVFKKGNDSIARSTTKASGTFSAFNHASLLLAALPLLDSASISPAQAASVVPTGLSSHQSSHSDRSVQPSSLIAPNKRFSVQPEPLIQPEFNLIQTRYRPSSPVERKQPILLAQAITPAPDGTGTVVTPSGDRLNIQGGQTSRDGANLFHSFSRFGLDQNQIANFISSPGVRNVLGRITGGDPSFINGLVQVTGSHANLFLMNPSGIVFGPNASLNIPGSFTATTASGIGFGNGWFNAIGSNTYADLVGEPSSFAFTMSQPGAIVNAGNLSVQPGQNLSLLAGTVASTGSLSAPGGQITVAAVPGTSRVRLSQAGSVLSLDIQPLDSSSSQPNGWNQPIATLPQLLTGQGALPGIGRLTVNQAGQVELSPAGVSVNQGDVAVREATARTVTLYADRNVTLVESQLRTSEDLNLLAKDTVWVRDSVQVPVVVQSGGNLRLQGNQGIDLLALNHPGTPFQSGGNLSLISDGVISGDAHFSSNGNFSILNLSGQPGNFVSLYDPIVSSNGDVVFGDYRGAALKVEAKGSITGGDITITSRDTRIYGSDSDIPTLRSSQALILRAGLSTLQNPSSSPSNRIFNIPPNSPPQGTSATVFSSSSGPSLPGNIKVEKITTSFSSPYGSDSGGPVILEATGNIQTGAIDSFSNSSSSSRILRGGLVSLNAGGSIETGDINSSYRGVNPYGSEAGAVNLTAVGAITTGAINTTSLNSANFRNSDNISSTAGFVTLQAGGNITFSSINTRATAVADSEISARGGDVTIDARGVVRGTTTIPSTNTTISTVAAPTPPPIVRLLAAVEAVPFEVGPTFQSGSVTIRHDGGPDNAPFIVGNATTNGTAGTINAGTGSITAASTPNSFPVLPNDDTASGTPGGIKIASINTPPSLTSNTLVGSIEQNQSLQFTSASLGINTADVNLDNVFVRVVSIAPGGTLTRNGVLVTPGTILSASDTLTYKPPANAIGTIVAFTIQADDRVSTSKLQPIQINVTPTPIPPTPTPTPIPIPIPIPIPTPPPKLPDNPEKDFTPPITPPIPLPINLPPVMIDPIMAAVDQTLTAEFTDYFGLPGGRPIRTLAEAQELLQKIESASGVKPALIYAVFEPDSFLAGTSNLAAATVNQTKAINSKDEKVSKDNDQLELLLVTPKGNPVRLPISGATRSRVLAIANEFRREVADQRKTRTDSYLESSKQLYQWLITPLEPTLKARDIQNLTFLLDAGLRSAPLAALTDGQTFLIEKYSIGLMPSLSLTDTRYVDIRKTQLLAMGASQFSDKPTLPAVPIELSALADDLWKGRSFLNQDFTLQNLKAQRQQQPFGIIHLATHGEFKPGVPGNSYIQLWDTQLRTTQLRQLGWNNPPVELLVLSACRTALGDKDAELGFAGLAVQAGVKSALGSLWYVSDVGTLALTTEFYRKLNQAPIKAEALRQAQLAILKGQVHIQDNQILQSDQTRGVALPPSLANAENSNLKHPYYWSAFTMIGNPW